MLPCDRLQGGELETEPAGDLPVLRVERLGRDQEAQGTGGGSHPPPFPSLPSLLPSLPDLPTAASGRGRVRSPSSPPSFPPHGAGGPELPHAVRGEGGGSARCLRDGEGGHRDGGGNQPRRGLPPCHLPRRLFRSGAVPQRRRFLLLLLLLPEVSRNTGGRGGPGHRARPACGGALWSPAGPRPCPGGCAEHNGWERVPAPEAAAHSVICVFFL